MVQYEYEIMQKSFQSAYIRQRTAQNTFAIDESKKRQNQVRPCSSYK